ncbi:MAG: 16S rRNA (guanine(527)-N(7))-methyltransferase RsmG [Bacteroidales bacterium]|nr:16S rRNA (guanine(527)-N(7))-methyltransferase RsmG [Bacteroidales bacterium]
MELILKYFPGITEKQIGQFDDMERIYSDWNSKVNVISRKDFGFFYERHVLHSLGIAKIIRFADGIKILDAGTGGGFPGIPLAVLFPKANFHLVDSIGKKIKVVEDVNRQLGLINSTCEQNRLDNLSDKYDFIVSRAVTALPDFIDLTWKLISPIQRNTTKNGILYLKGGEFNKELKSLNKSYQIYNLNLFFEEPYFETKKLIHIYR